jgi:site-specific recombinase XerC
LNEKNLSPASINIEFSALRHFYEMNDIDLKWNKINSLKEEFHNMVEDRPYTRMHHHISQEIKLLVDRADLRNKAIILLLASSGVRMGTIPGLNKDLERIDK